MANWIVPIVVALIAPIIGYLGVVRKLSGRVDTSEAAILWNEATAMREEWHQRAVQCEKQLLTCKNELQTLTARNTILAQQNRNMRDELKRRAL